MTNRLHRLQQSGVTLIEILLAMGLTSVFMVILTTMFTATMDTQVQSESYSAVVQDSRAIMARLNYDIRRATAIPTPNNLGVTSNSLTLTTSGGTYTYALDPTTGALRLTDPANVTDVLSGNGVKVSNLSFQKFGNSGGKETIQYKFTLTSVAQQVSGPETQSFTSTVERR